MILVVAYFLTIPAANLLIQHVGTVCIPSGPCLIPVAPWIMAPSGVLMIGIALVLRDLVQRRYGALVSLACIGVGTALSAFIAPPALVIASATAFLLSELADFAVYTSLMRERAFEMPERNRFMIAVLLSCIVGAVVDSAVFLWLAFGSLDHLTGQVVGKLYASIALVGWRYWFPARPRAMDCGGG